MYYEKYNVLTQYYKNTIVVYAILMKQLLAREGIELNFESVSKIQYTHLIKGPTIWVLHTMDHLSLMDTYNCT